MDELNFTRSILLWYDAGHRDLPWRRTKDAYSIWVSEIMLQQTRAETVIPYYNRFLSHYPDVRALANAPQEELLKLWEGLGYYSRARSLQKAAKIIVEEYDGELPADVEKLRALPGIGEYTSGAIASIAFGIPVPAVDGNVERVICRYFAIQEEMGTPAARKKIQVQAQKLVPPERAGAFANAMMEMGATMCTPKTPACLLCPVRAGCEGYKKGIALDLPVKPKKKAQRVEKHCVMLIFCENRVLTVIRKEKLLGGLSVFPDIQGETTPAQMVRELEAWGISAVYDEKLGNARHVFTHLIWDMEIHAFAAQTCTAIDGGRWVNAQELEALPMPTAVKAARKYAMGKLTSANV